MKHRVVDCVCWEIPASGSLDAIHVFWVDISLGVGYVTIICWGQAWTAHFGGMSGMTIKQFFASCDIGYLVSKMAMTPLLKQSKANEAYLGRIIGAVKAAIAKATGDRPHTADAQADGVVAKS